ncbi:hypothetical protein ATCC90586_008118 [Pythium insidiosum]|nr:hypothetical protein ATCC90586_008118 [Pythium insidiosum]
MLLALLKPLSKATSPGSILLVNKPRNRLKQPSFARREIDLIRQLDDKASSYKLRDNLIDPGSILLVNKPRNRLKQPSLARREIDLIRHLDDKASSDKLRDNPIESAGRTVHIQQAFVKLLRKEARHSNRIKHIIDLVDFFPLHADSQHKILDEEITLVLKSNEVNEKLHEAEEAAAKKKAHEQNCTGKMSEAEKIEKTLSTFSPAERILAAQHRKANFETSDKLVAALLLDKKHDAKMDPCEIWKALEKTYGLGDAGGLIELTRQWTKLAGTSFRDLVTHFAMLKKLRNDINRKSQALRKRKTGSKDSTSCFYCFGSGQYKKDCPVL